MSVNKIIFIFKQKDMDRKDVRKKVVEKFLEELHGPGADETYKRYQYVVEKTKSGNIILTRPANLKLGFDFRVDVEGMLFKKGSNSPSHEDIFNDLKYKHDEDKKYAEKVRMGIIDVYNMKEPEDIIKKIKEKNIGLKVDLLLKLAKWLAIEQDIRYWNGWGRVKNVKWLELIHFFDYKFKIIKKNKIQTFVFFDKNGKELTENKAMKIMRSL